MPAHPPGPIPHGTPAGYRSRGCRCEDCTEANRLACRAWYAKSGRHRRWVRMGLKDRAAALGIDLP